MSNRRYAVIRQTDARTVDAYLPGNYQVVGEVANEDRPPDTIIVGEDHAGWTLEDYVLPRLASGLHAGNELTEGTL